MITISVEQYERLIRFSVIIGMNLGLMLIAGIILWINEIKEYDNSQGCMP